MCFMIPESFTHMNEYAGQHPCEVGKQFCSRRSDEVIEVCFMHTALCNIKGLHLDCKTSLLYFKYAVQYSVLLLAAMRCSVCSELLLNSSNTWIFLQASCCHPPYHITAILVPTYKEHISCLSIPFFSHYIFFFLLLL